MKDIVVIATSPGREQYLEELLSSVSRPVIVVSDFGFELGKIKWIYENTNCDRFLFLQDSIVIRDESLFDQVFENKGSACIMDVPKCLGSYMGVYERSVLSKIEIPRIQTKEESIRYEIEWTQKYIAECDNFGHPVLIQQKELESVRRFGRENFLYVNQYYEKWKGDWGVTVEGFETQQIDIQSKRINLQMLEKSRLIQNLVKENNFLEKTIASWHEGPPEGFIELNKNEKLSLLREIFSLGEKLKQAEMNCANLENSTIWKATKPYRKFRSLLRKIVQN